jgi:hypothetical protein
MGNQERGNTIAMSPLAPKRCSQLHPNNLAQCEIDESATPVKLIALPFVAVWALRHRVTSLRSFLQMAFAGLEGRHLLELLPANA